MLASRSAVEAELPPPHYTNPIKKLDAIIQKLLDLQNEDILEWDDKIAIEVAVEHMRRRRRTMIRERDDKIREAWMPYWAIWGVKEGQEGLY